MRKSHNRVQKNQEEINEYLFRIFDLRSRGLSSVKIGKELNKDHTTILYQIKKHKYESKYILEWKRPPKYCKRCGRTIRKVRQKVFCDARCSGRHHNGFRKARKWWPKFIIDERGEQICTGKTYKEYLHGNTRD